MPNPYDLKRLQGQNNLEEIGVNLMKAYVDGQLRLLSDNEKFTLNKMFHDGQAQNETNYCEWLLDCPIPKKFKSQFFISRKK